MSTRHRRKDDRVEQIVQELVKEGLLEHIPGEFRRGQPVYRITELGRAYHDRLKGKLQ